MTVEQFSLQNSPEQTANTHKVTHFHCTAGSQCVLLVRESFCYVFDGYNDFFYFPLFVNELASGANRANTSSYDFTKHFPGLL